MSLPPDQRMAHLLWPGVPVWLRGGRAEPPEDAGELRRITALWRWLSYAERLRRGLGQKNAIVWIESSAALPDFVDHATLCVHEAIVRGAPGPLMLEISLVLQSLSQQDAAAADWMCGAWLDPCSRLARAAAMPQREPLERKDLALAFFAARDELPLRTQQQMWSWILPRLLEGPAGRDAIRDVLAQARPTPRWFGGDVARTQRATRDFLRALLRCPDLAQLADTALARQA